MLFVNVGLRIWMYSVGAIHELPSDTFFPGGNENLHQLKINVRRNLYQRDNNLKR